MFRNRRKSELIRIIERPNQWQNLTPRPPDCCSTRMNPSREIEKGTKLLHEHFYGFPEGELFNSRCGATETCPRSENSKKRQKERQAAAQRLEWVTDMGRWLTPCHFVSHSPGLWGSIFERVAAGKRRGVRDDREQNQWHRLFVWGFFFFNSRIIITLRLFISES